MKNAGMPELNSVSVFRPGIPASFAGVVPIPFGWPKTLYRNQPKRKSVSKSGGPRSRAPAAIEWFRESEVPAYAFVLPDASSPAASRCSRTIPALPRGTAAGYICPKQVEFVGCVVIHSSIERFVIELDSAGRREVRLIRSCIDVRQRDQLQQILRLARKPVSRDDVIGKLRAGSRSGAAGGIENIEAQTAEDRPSAPPQSERAATFHRRYCAASLENRRSKNILFF